MLRNKQHRIRIRIASSSMQLAIDDIKNSILENLLFTWALLFRALRLTSTRSAMIEAISFVSLSLVSKQTTMFSIFGSTKTSGEATIAKGIIERKQNPHHHNREQRDPKQMEESEWREKNR